MHRWLLVLGSLVATARVVLAACPDYTTYSEETHEPLSSGKYQLSYMRPAPACRTFNSSVVDRTIADMRGVIKDPDLYRLFENAFPSTLDTTVTWKGYADNGTDEELTFIITGDITAMWLRDSANQLRSYKALLAPSSSPDSLASLFRGAINLQARYVTGDPYCNAFQPPSESGLAPAVNGAASDDAVAPPYDNATVFECKYELDSLSAFLQLSADYHDRTNDTAFFGRYGWVDAVRTVVNVTAGLRAGTYAPDGAVVAAPYSFTRETSSASDSQINSGAGSPVRGGTGLVRSWFRPSDDATIYQLFVPANMMFTANLAKCAAIMQAHDAALAGEMRALAASVRAGIEAYGKTTHPEFGQIYTYEMDGFGSHNLMDDANVPSLLGAPVVGYLDASDETYQNTRRYVLSTWNPYYMHGPVINGTGGPHDGPGKAWPMSVIVELLTSDSDSEIIDGLGMLVSSTNQLGLIHESINTFNASQWTRQWFSWANGLFGEMILDLKDRKPGILSTSFQ
ncbi:glycoside hydrolase family 125 protein [Xylariaceae sp. FL0804]|nr:glycoside hydrolase family 125 protein [Xylariaceae sp. FL0804]